MNGRDALLALPVAVVTIGLAGVAAIERVSPQAFATLQPRNAAEAAALGDAAEVLRRLRFGEDPTRIESLRPQLASSEVRRATTLEAAIWSREREMIEMLDRQGVIVDVATRHHLACLASDLQLPDIAEYLSADVAGCVPGQAVKQVIDRTEAHE